MRVTAASAVEENTSARPPPIALLISLSSLWSFAFGTFPPSIPSIAREFGASPAVAQFALSLFLVGVSFGHLGYGVLSDFLGRRTTLLPGLGVALVAGALSLVAPTIELLLLCRLLIGVGVCAGVVMARVMINDTVPPNRVSAALSHVQMGIIGIVAITPSIGGALDDRWGWRASGLAMVILTAVVLAWAVVAVPATTAPKARRLTVGLLAEGAGYLLRTPRFVGYAICSASTFGAAFGFITGSSFLTMQVLGWNAASFGLWMATSPLSMVLGGMIASRLSPRLGIDRMVVMGTVLALFAAAIHALLAWGEATAAAAIFLPAALGSVATGILSPNTIAGAMATERRYAGAAAGLLGFVQTLAGATAAIVVARLSVDSLAPIVIVVVACRLVGSVAFLIGRRFPVKPAAPTAATP